MISATFETKTDARAKKQSANAASFPKAHSGPMRAIRCRQVNHHKEALCQIPQPIPILSLAYTSPLFLEHHDLIFLDTTRKPRAGEENGKEYHFVEKPEFEQLISEGQFVEHAQFASNFYGTSKAAIQQIQQDGKWCMLDVDLQGVKSVRRLGLFAKVIFVMPPCLEALRGRLTFRGTESKESLDLRLKAAKEDMAAIEEEPELCDLVVVNDDLEKSFAEIESFIFHL